MGLPALCEYFSQRLPPVYHVYAQCVYFSQPVPSSVTCFVLPIYLMAKSFQFSSVSTCIMHFDIGSISHSFPVYNMYISIMHVRTISYAD